MKLLLAALILVSILWFLAGCSTGPLKQRELLLSPERPNINRQAIIDNAAQAQLMAYSKPSPQNVFDYADAGSSLNVLYCTEYLYRDTLASQGLVLSEHNLGVVSAFMTAVAGIAKWSSSAVAALGATEVMVAGLGNNLRQAIGAPSQYTAQVTLLNLLGTCQDKLLDEARTLKPAQVDLRLSVCWRTCTSGAAQAATESALQNTPLEVTRSGTLKAVKP